MKQLIQNLGNGETLLTDIPTPSVGRNQVLIASQSSLVSLGTEKMIIDFGKASLLEKARKQPDRVKDVLNKIKTDGLSATLEAVRAKLDQPVPLGYCNAGVVLAVGNDVRAFRPGDRVVSNGPHAEVVSVSENLCAKIPDSVSFDHAAFAVLGAVAMQGVRLSEPTLGETFVVTGLGLIGLIAVQLLRANGCRVMGIDFDPAKCEIARQFGVHTVCLATGGDPIAEADMFSRGRGVDGVLITASTKSDEVIHQAAVMCRKRGRVVLTGVIGLNIKREDFYKKEISFQVSCAYGPGRYEEAYEDRGLDYPIGFVRWTAQRNFEAYLDLSADGKIDTETLISKRAPFADAIAAYASLGGKTLGVVLQYPEATDRPELMNRSVGVPALATAVAPKSANVVAGVLGAGNFSGLILVPSLKAAGGRLHTIVSNTGITAAHLAKKHGFERVASSADEVFSSPEITTVFVTTRHDSHAAYVARSVRAGKRVFVEKPLAISREELEDVKLAVAESPSPFVMLGFNRRFSPHIQKLKGLLASENRPKSIVYTVNAGMIPSDHWTQNPLVGGGRIIGEGCHFIDLVRYLVGHPIVEVAATSAKDSTGQAIEDEVTITLRFADGSTGTVLYFASGAKTFPKERLEVFVNGKVAQMDNFRVTTGFNWPALGTFKTRGQEKGHREEFVATVEAIQAGKPAPIPFSEIIEVTEACFTAVEQIRGI